MKREDGQTLIEILLAVGVAAAIITAIAAVVISALNNATFRKNQNLATSYAQQGMEVVRAIRDRSWTDFSLLDGWMCLPQNSTTLTPRVGLDCDGEGNVGIFIREIRMQLNQSDCTASVVNTKVTVAVKWSDSKCTSPPPFNYCQEVKLISCLTKINAVGAP